MLKYFNCSQSIQVIKWQRPSTCTVWYTGSNMEILKQEILPLPCCSIEYIESFLFCVILVTYNIGIHICIYIYILIKLAILILFLLSSTVISFLHCVLNILRYEQIFFETDESIALQHNPSSDVTFLGVHSESTFPFME